MNVHIICIVTIVMISAAIIYLFINNAFIKDENHFYVIVNSKNIIGETDEKFLSVALDMSFMRCLFHKFNDSDWEKLKEFSSLLSPAYIRIGGTDADYTFFDLNSTNDKQFLKNNSCEDYLLEKELIISGKDWIKLNEFVRKSELSLIMDLNVLIRSNARWNSSNAKALINFSQENSLPLDFQLGNEPNSFPHVFNVTISGTQLAEDFYQLRKLLNSSDFYKKSKLIGPDITRPNHSSSLKFLSEFLSKKNVVDVTSWHQYYLNGRNATLEDFINPETFALFPAQVADVVRVVRRHSASMPIWISETSSAYGGGAPKLSNRYVASFLWLDKLGVAAGSNMSVVIRQSLFKDNYALITENFRATPDFWISVLYKQLVGHKVLNVTLGREHVTKLVRLYGHCLASKSSLNGSIVIFGLNLGKETELFVPSGISIVYPVYAFMFRAEFNNLKARSVLLNNQKLVYNETIVEDMLRMAEKVELPLTIPSYTIGFWVLKEIKEYACAR